MAYWLESVKDIVSLVADSKTILGIGAGGLALVSGTIAVEHAHWNSDRFSWRIT